MKVLITGGAGFIGSYLVEESLAQGHDVTILDNLATGRLENVAHLEADPHFHMVIGDILNEVLVDKLVERCDWVFHLAAAVGVGTGVGVAAATQPATRNAARRTGIEDPFRRSEEGVLPVESPRIGAYPLSRRFEHDRGSGDRTSSGGPAAAWLVTVAGLCRILTGFADPAVRLSGCHGGL